MVILREPARTNGRAPSPGLSDGHFFAMLRLARWAATKGEMPPPPNCVAGIGAPAFCGARAIDFLKWFATEGEMPPPPNTVFNMRTSNEWFEWRTAENLDRFKQDDHFHMPKVKSKHAKRTKEVNIPVRICELFTLPDEWIAMQKAGRTARS